jgi:hypothetical protein
MTHTDLRGFMFITACACVLLGSAPVPAWTEQDATLDEGLPEMVVEAENKVEQEIRKTTHDVPLSAAIIDTFYCDTDELILAISPVEGLQPFLNNPEPMHSDQVPHPWLHDPAVTPVVTFYPEDPEGHKARKWSLTVTDYRGATFRRYDEGGKPPKSLDWDGRGDRDEILQVGYPYSYIFSVTDKGTNTYNYAGVSFRIPAVDYVEGIERCIDITGDEVFKRGASRLSETGEGWLVRAADQIREDHPRAPMKVVVQAESKRLAEDRAEKVAAFLADHMVLADEWVGIEAVAKPDLRSEMDGSVSIRVTHADDG